MPNKGYYKRKAALRNKLISHHVRYQYDGISHKQEPRTVKIYNTEHYVTRLLQTRGHKVTKGFLLVLADFILDRLITGDYIDAKMVDNNNKKNIQKKTKAVNNNKIQTANKEKIQNKSN